MTHQLNCSPHSAPKARDVKAWANGPGNGEIVVKALKARNKSRNAKEGFSRAFSALGFAGRLPGAWPRAVASRTFGADKIDK